MVGHFIKDNSPTILTVVGVTGTVSTAILTGRASFRAAEVIRDAEIHPFKDGEDGFWVRKTNKERFELVWKLYIPPAVVGGATLACIIGANTISSKRTAALVSAYTVAETTFRDYKDKVVEQIGANNEQKVRDAVAQDRVTANPPEDSQLVILGSGDVLCFDQHSGRYFQGNMEAIRKAENDLNYEIINGMGGASLNDFYHKLGLDPLSHGDDVGWNSDKKLSLHVPTARITKDNQPALVISFRDEPFPNFYKVW